MNKSITTFRFFALSAMAISILLTSCNGGSTGKEQTTAEDSARVVVETSTAAYEKIRQTELFSATIEAKTTNNIAPQMAGRIKSISVEVGTFVRKGQVLAVMDNSQLNQARVQMNDAKIAFERTDELFKVGGISQAQWEARRSALSIAETNFQNIQENTILRSPINGVVTARNYDNGDMTSPTTPIFVVQEINPVQLRFNVPERLYSKVVKGMPASLTVDALGEEVFDGKVSLIYPTINATTHTFPVEVEVNNGKNILRPGMFARASLDFGEQQKLLVSDRAVVKQSGSGEYYAFTLDGNKAVRHNLKIGTRINDKVEIIEGLKEGDVVITEGAQTLRNGVRVRVVNK